MVYKKRGEDIVNEVERLENLIQRNRNKFETALNTGRRQKIQRDINSLVFEKEEFMKYGNKIKEAKELRAEINDLTNIKDRKSRRLTIRNEVNQMVEQMINDLKNNSNQKFAEMEDLLEKITV